MLFFVGQTGHQQKPQLLVARSWSLIGLLLLIGPVRISNLPPGACWISRNWLYNTNILLGQWFNFKLIGITYVVRKIKFKPLSQGPLAESDILSYNLGGGNSKIFYFHPYLLGEMIPFWRAYFSDGLVKNHQLVGQYPHPMNKCEASSNLGRKDDEFHGSTSLRGNATSNQPAECLLPPLILMESTC